MSEGFTAAFETCDGKAVVPKLKLGVLSVVFETLTSDFVAVCVLTFTPKVTFEAEVIFVSPNLKPWRPDG